MHELEAAAVAVEAYVAVDSFGYVCKGPDPVSVCFGGSAGCGGGSTFPLAEVPTVAPASTAGSDEGLAGTCGAGAAGC